MGSRQKTSAAGQHSYGVVLPVAEAADDAAEDLDETIDGFGSAVTGAVGFEVAEELGLSLLEGAAEAGDLRDRAGRERATTCSAIARPAATVAWW